LKNRLSTSDFVWSVEAVCTLLQKPFQRDLVVQQYSAQNDLSNVVSALSGLGISSTAKKLKFKKIASESFPLLVFLSTSHEDVVNNESDAYRPAILLQATTEKVMLIRPGDAIPATLATSDFQARCTGEAMCLTNQIAESTDPDATILSAQSRRFGFSWFIPELLKHKKLWQEILLASLIIQLMALATPLFTQTIIDKVITNRTESTLMVVLIGMGVFIVFTTILNWLRQYLVLHTGNRVDAVLGTAVFERLFKLPPMYFQHRPTGVISARLHGVETIREFIAGTAVTLILDFPFLLIFVAIMFYYSVTLTVIVLGIMLLIGIASFLVAPLFQKRLQEQFLMGARNQAFVTEYVAGMETVKSLQLEPQLTSRYRQYLATYLTAGFSTKQLANTYNSFAQMLEQIMTLLILGVGAWTVMNNAEFTIGMLIAFQMFAGRVSQPMLRLVGLWQQFQQAKLSVDRLGDLMNAPIEPYNLTPKRVQAGRGRVELQNLAFRYTDKLPLLYKNLNAELPGGQTIAIMGPSGSGKSTLAKLLQGFYQPTEGRIKIDGIDIANLSANELRSHFGVVPQETMLFSGTILDNLQMANPLASFEQIVTACRLAEVNTTIEELPEGYQTEIGERGAGLSGGQRQRIAIARALLKRPKILVFDEATSALDAPTAELFAKTINGLRGKVTMVFITHSLPRGLKLDALFQLTASGLQNVKLTDSPVGAAGVTPIHKPDAEKASI
jgi:ATP-binding cassette, subfamily B, bacterial HlyB/CyaB